MVSPAARAGWDEPSPSDGRPCPDCRGQGILRREARESD